MATSVSLKLKKNTFEMLFHLHCCVLIFFGMYLQYWNYYYLGSFLLKFFLHLTPFCFSLVSWIWIIQYESFIIFNFFYKHLANFGWMPKNFCQSLPPTDTNVRKDHFLGLLNEIVFLKPQTRGWYHLFGCWTKSVLILTGILALFWLFQGIINSLYPHFS